MHNLRKMANVFFTLMAMPLVGFALDTFGKTQNIGENGPEALMRGTFGFAAFLFGAVLMLGYYGLLPKPDFKTARIGYIAAHLVFLLTLTFPYSDGYFAVEPALRLVRVIFTWVFPMYVLLDIYLSRKHGE